MSGKSSQPYLEREVTSDLSGEQTRSTAASPRSVLKDPEHSLADVSRVLIDSSGQILAQNENSINVLNRAIASFKRIQPARSLPTTEDAMAVYKGDEDRFVTVPSNFESFADSVIMLHYIAMAVKLKYEVRLSTTILEPFKETKEIKYFWSAFFATLRDWEPNDGKISFRGTSDTQLGINGARLTLWKSCSSFSQSYVHFLPDKSVLIGKNRLEPVSHYCKLATVGAARDSHEAAFAALKIIINEYAASRTSGWGEIHYNIPLGQALEGLHRSKTVKERGKDKIVPIHPNRPSQRIEVFSKAEQELLKQSENAFNRYDELLAPYKKEQSVAIKYVPAFRKAASKAINDMWEVVQRFTAPLTKRRTIAYTYISKKGKGTLSLTKQSWMDILELIRQKGDRKDISLFSPLPLEVKSQEIILSAADVLQREKALNGSLLLVDLKRASFSRMPHWEEFFTFFGSTQGKYDSYYQSLAKYDEWGGDEDHEEEKEDDSFSPSG